MRKIAYSAPVLIELTTAINASGACAPFGSNDATGDCSTGNLASGGFIISCSQGNSPVNSGCASGINPRWFCYSGSGV